MKWFLRKITKQTINFKEMEMKTIIITLLLVAVFALSGFAQQGTVETRIGELEFKNGYPSQKSVEKLYDEIDFQRACQAYLWGLPMLATEAFVESFKDDLGAQWGDLIEVKTFQDRSYGITANATTDYMFTWVDLSETGPVLMPHPIV